MHPDLSPHLHTEECNQLIQALFTCRKESPFLKFIGKCNTPYDQMLVCLKKERLARRELNVKKSEEKHKRVLEAMKKDTTDYEELLKQYGQERRPNASN